MKKRILLVDGDMVAYRHAAVAAGSGVIDWGDGIVSSEDRSEPMRRCMDRFLAGLREKLQADRVCVFISDDKNFRHDLNAGYKTNRKDKERPPLLEDFKDYLFARHSARSYEGLEADDLMGIQATHPEGEWVNRETIIVSIDKDMRQIPGLLYNPFPHKREPAVEVITRAQADIFFLFQTLTGDVIDGYKGCPGVGPKRAMAALLESPTWETVVSLYESKGLTEADALVQARMARILRYEDWSIHTGVKLWTPS